MTGIEKPHESSSHAVGSPMARRWRALVHALHLHDDRGDVPGWVLVAVMTAGLVTAIWLVADDQLTAVLGRAISSVTQP